MRVAIYCPFLASLLLGAVAPALARRLPPGTATRLLTAWSVLAAVATSSALAVLALTLVGRLPLVAALGHWSPGRLASTSPVPPAVAGIAVVAVALLAVNAIRVAVLRTRAVLDARALCRGLGAGPGQLVVVDDDVATMAVPVAGGRIVASRAQLAALPAPERRALLLHEGAHLAGRHHLYRLAADLAAAVDPLQSPVRSAVRYATERWADEQAAAALGDRAAVARALAREGLRAARTPSRARWAAVALHGNGSRVVPRVRALLAPAPRQRPGLLLATAVLVAFSLLAAVHAQEDTELFFDRAAAFHTVPAAPADVIPGR